MKSMNKWILTGIITIATAGFCAQAEEGKAPEGKGGKCEGKCHAKMLEKFDANKDGKLDDAEKAAAKAEREKNKAEHKAKMLEKFDANKDGKLDDAEKAAAKAAHQAKCAEHKGGKHGGKKGEGKPAAAAE